MLCGGAWTDGDPPAELTAFFQRQLPLHAYNLGDLSEPFWHRVRWLGWRERGELVAAFLVYGGATPPVLLALEEARPEAAAALLAAALAAGQIPASFYGHVSPPLVGMLAARGPLEVHGEYLKMQWVNPAAPVKPADDISTRALTDRDLGALSRLYEAAYEGNWFEPEMLAHGVYHGAFLHDALVAVAGTHIFAPTLGVAALGNVATSPPLRGRGLAQLVVTRLCEALAPQVAHIALNVRADDESAVGIYGRCGFEERARFIELSSA